MEPRISMITLGVANISRSVEFYGQGLSLPQYDFQSEEVAFFKLTGTWLGLYGREALAEDAQVSSKRSGFAGFSLAYNVSSNEEVDCVLEEAKNAGAIIVKPGQEVFWGGYSGYFQDPDNYLWEVAHNPHFWIGPEAVPKEQRQ
ncbi:MAG: VOC family protein [Bdellovibrionales bacterium]|nr:VOC family protein [Bdellovibrionales bacterium]